MLLSLDGVRRSTLTELLTWQPEGQDPVPCPSKRHPAIIPAPKIMVRLVMGEMASALFDSHRVNPEKLLASGFTFQYSDLDRAIQQIVQ